MKTFLELIGYLTDVNVALQYLVVIGTKVPILLVVSTEHMFIAALFSSGELLSGS